MHAFEWFIGLMLGAMLLSALARRLGVPYPTFLALGGVGIAFLPNAPAWVLEPDVALALFVAPVLLDAAFDTSLRDLRRNWFPVVALVVGAVAVTTVAVAVVARWLIPEMPWAVAIALGAIVAPPDAAAATAVLKTLKLPHRLLTILEGESLLNDATALIIYRIAVGAAMAATLDVSSIAPTLFVTVFGSLVVGYALARMSSALMGRIHDVPSSIIMQFMGTFVVWIVAEKLEISAILTIVVYAITIARSAPAEISAQLRVPSYAVWETAVYLLNVLAFILIGMQLKPIWLGLDSSLRTQSVVFAGVVLAAIIVTRVAWVLGYAAFLQVFFGYFSKSDTDIGTVFKSRFLISWCGMRGIVTLATAFALPQGFPYRELILLTAFAVVLGTLVIQGITLRPLISLLALDDDDPVGQEVGWARRAAFHAALEAIDGNTTPEAEFVRLEYRKMLEDAESNPDGLTSSELPGDPVRREGITAARRKLLDMRNNGDIGDAAFHRLEEEFDRAELSAM